MGTSKSNTGGTGGSWTSFKRNASYFAAKGGPDRAGKVLAGYVAAMGGVATTLAAAAIGIRTGQSFGLFLSRSSGPQGIVGGLDAVGLERLVGEDRLTILNELSTELAGDGADLDAQAARRALIDVLEQVLPTDTDVPLESVQLSAEDVSEAIRKYVGALVYNLAIPFIDEKLTRLEDAALAQRRNKELLDFIDALVRLRTYEQSPLSIDWQGDEGRALIEGILQATYEQVEAWT